MSIFSRISTLIKSNINDLISRAEDPEKILNQLIVDMREQLNEAKKQVAKTIADEKLLKKQYDNEAFKAREWEKKAMQAVRAGRDDLAVEALARKEQYDNLAEEFRRQWEDQKAASDQLRAALKQLHNKIEEARRKKDLLIARKRRVEAQKRIQETMQGFGDTSAFDQFERMSQKIDNMEAEAEAAAELNSDMQDMSLEDKFRAFEVDHGASEALAALKAKMGVAAPARVVVEEEEDEFDFEALERELAEARAEEVQVVETVEVEAELRK